MSETLLEIKGVGKNFGGGRSLFGKMAPAVHAVRQVDLIVNKGETLGVVGESGCGKSTLARMVVGLDVPTVGTISYDGVVINELKGKAKQKLAQNIQYVFQDPVSSLNPRKTIRAILEAPLKYLSKMDAKQRLIKLEELMSAVNLRFEFLDRYPHEFSGGQAQRIGIARALATNPDILVLDEPVSALDVSIQAQILNLLADLKSEYELTYIFISHDLSVIEKVSDRVAVMYFGAVAELADSQELFAKPAHHYTNLLLQSVPILGKKNAQAEKGNVELPDPLNPPQGCAFAARCPRADKKCTTEVPKLRTVVEGNQQAACFFPIEENYNE